MTQATSAKVTKLNRVERNAWTKQKIFDAATKVVGKYGYAAMFFAFAGCTVVYFVTAAFFLPETKGRTLEEIEAAFEKNAPKT